MPMTREQMDALVDTHFSYEAADDVDGVLATLADGAEHEVIPSPFGAVRDRSRGPVRRRRSNGVQRASVTTSRNPTATA
jgi:hypothetical protein